MPVTNDQGEVALKYYQSQNRILVQKTPSGQDYVFVNRASITLAWVLPEDEQHLLSRRKNCCGNHKKKVFFYANEDDVRRWTNGGGR